MRKLPALALATAGALALSSCGSATADGPETEPTVTVGAAFYPLQFVVQRVGGDLADISLLTQPGVEAHDLELSPAAVRGLQDVDTLVYLDGFQPAVDAAIQVTGVRALDAGHVFEAHEADHDHEDGHDHADGDPHFWLDPSLMALLADEVAEELADLDPGNAATYDANAAELVAELEELDESYSTGLAQCERRELFVGHEAFGYLSERYDLTQQGLAGVDPESEPSPARAREIRDTMSAVGATTLFVDSPVSTGVAEAIARDAGVEVQVLDPIEGVAGDDDYIVVMLRNLDALRTALDCA